MENIIKNSSHLYLLPFIILLSSCMADLRTPLVKKEGISAKNQKIGKEIMEKAWQRHGFDNLRKHRVYSFHGKDIWRGMMGKIGKPWPEAKSEMDFKYAINTFDSQVAFNDGKRQGVIAGLQSWKYYEKEQDGKIIFQPYNKRIGFGLSAYHYFFEMLDRLKSVPIISYAGEREFNGQNYDLIFATWNKAEPHIEHDQYVLWINKTTGFLEYAVYTLRENYLKMPGYKAFYGSIKFMDLREIDGVLIPHKQIIFLNKPSKKEKKHLHQLDVSDFKFDSFELNELYPDPAISKIGDSKVRR